MSESEHLLLKNLQGTISPSERKLLIRWIEEGKLSKEKILAWEEIWQRSQLEFPLLEEKKIQEVLQKLYPEPKGSAEQDPPQERPEKKKIALSKRIEFEQEQESEWRKRFKKRRSKNSWWAFGVVVFFAIGLGVGLQYLNTYLDKQPKSWRSKILSDSSRVKYTTDSRFVFPTAFRENERAVQLVGLAAFDVQSDRVSFVVDGGSFRVKTKKAKFEMASQDSTFVRICEGKAVVYTTYDTLARLSAQEQLYFDRKLRKWTVKKTDCSYFIGE